MKRSNPSITELANEDWVFENPIFLSNNLRESSFSLEYQGISKKIRDTFFKDDDFVGAFIPPLN